MRGRIENGFVDSTVCFSERPPHPSRCARHLLPKGRRLWRSAKPSPSGGRWHPASHGSRMTDEGADRERIRRFQRSAFRNAPSSVSLRSTPSLQRGEGSVGVPASRSHRRFRPPDWSLVTGDCSLTCHSHSAGPYRYIFSVFRPVRLRNRLTNERKRSIMRIVCPEHSAAR